MANSDDPRIKEYMRRLEAAINDERPAFIKVVMASFEKFCEWLRRIGLWYGLCKALGAVGKGIAWIWDKLTDWF